MKCQDMDAVQMGEVEKNSQSYLFTNFQTSDSIQNNECSG